MANNMDKGLYQLPQGMAQDVAPEAGAVEVQIENPDSVTIGTDGMEIVIEPGKETNDEFNANLAEDMDERDLVQLAGDLLGDFTADINSRKDWLTTYVDGLELLGLKIDERTEPWPGACNVYHPLMTEALVK